MGFSTIGATAVLFAGILFAAGTFANAAFEAYRETNRAENEAHRRDTLQLGTALSVVGAKQGQNYDVAITNEGSTTLDASLITVLIDGVVDNTAIQNQDVGGKTTDVWAPGEVLNLHLRANPAPARIVVAVETGAQVAYLP